jgi:BirA family transcriptional regulator, biotin operon repressor / biotin---[acetyl-CoA-carboxylase] ligase
MTIPPPDKIWSFDTTHLGRRISVYDRLDSTNTLALSLSHEPAEHGFVVLAREQTAGRGQHGRTWHAPPGSSVLMSVLLFPPPALHRPVLLTAWAAVCVSETILKLANLQAKIKWPNDVLIQGKKVCGILIEQCTTGNPNFPLAAVVGIGLNVTQSAEGFLKAGLPDAASLASMSGSLVPYEPLVKELIRSLDEQYGLLLDGDFNTLEALWKGRLDLLGKFVVIEGVHQRHRGRLLNVTFAGLDLEVESGDFVRLAPESVKHIS